MVHMFHVYKGYERGHMALHDINLLIDKGDFFIVTGGNGAGKTTLLKLVSLEEKVTNGQILINGTKLSNLHRSEIPFLRRKIGMVFQEPRLLLNRTVFGNVALPLEIMGCNKNSIQEKVISTLKQLRLSDKMNFSPLTLSSSEQQKVAIARAIVNDPLLLLADEPTGPLDPTTAQEVMDIFREINLSGTTILFTTRNRKLADAVGKRSVVLDDGRIVG